jgi:hypothetical protein
MAAASKRIARSKGTAGYSGTPLANKLGLKEGGVVLWVSWPKKASKVPTDIGGHPSGSRIVPRICRH